ncbi:MAG: RagB/SusD family nutrient uptake outer membrane protein [Bacteroides sp.]|nr:RagB/SusD family nutrient uptake outer membrane protein [Bacteroides sp.]
MKITDYIVSLLVMAQILVLTGCNEWLNLMPEDGVPSKEYWKTKEDVHSAMNGIYASLISDGLGEAMFIFGELRADMIADFPRNPTDRFSRIIEGEIAADNATLDGWQHFYKTINLCNILIEYSHLAYENDESFTEKLLDEYLAQAVTIRSLMYFYLVRSFGDAPFSLEPYTNSAQTLSLAKSPKEEIILILIDHLEALNQSGNETLPFSYSNTDVAQNKGRVTAWMLKALLADLYLWNEQYDKCVEQCNQIINSGQFALIPVSRQEEIIEGVTEEDNISVYHPNEGDADNMFLSLYVNGNSVESIFEFQYSSEKLNPFWKIMNQTNGQLSANNSTLSDYIYPSTNTGDGSYYDIRQGMGVRQGYIWKYIGREREGSSREELEMTGNFIVYRLAEIYLMKAEALTQLGIQSGNRNYYDEALQVLQLIRNRGNAVESTDLIGTDNNFDGKTLEQFILWERAREFPYEGKRWYDLLRNAKRDNYAGNNLNYLLESVIRSAPAEKVYTLQTKFRSYNSHYFPIPQREIESNPLLTQNEFYAN